MDVSSATTVLRWVTQRERKPHENHLLLLVIALFAGSVVTELVGFETGLVRPVVVVSFLSLVPGHLLLRITGLRPRDLTTWVLYSLGLSLCFLMIYGVVLNTALPRIGVRSVFVEGVLFSALVLGVGGLFSLHVVRNEPLLLDLNSFVKTVWQPWPLGLLSIPFFAILGARTVTRFGNNTLIVAVLALLGLLTVAAYLEYLPKRLFPVAIWAVAASLLLHNSVLTHSLAWDAGKELRLAGLVVDNGVWQAGVGGNWMKNAMLRIVILHPVYSILADIDFVWEFKTVAPLLFSFAPVAFYKSYQAVVDKSDAFLAALLPMSFFSFFTVLSWNSRTSGALLFLSLVVLTVTDQDLTRRTQRILMGIFLFGILVSHYGTAFIMLAAMGLILLGNWVLVGFRHTSRRARTTTTVVLFFGLLVFLWYVFIVHRAGAFTRLVTFSYEFFGDLAQDLFGTGTAISAEESTTAQYVSTRYTSNTITWLQSLNLLLGALAGISIAALGIRRLLNRVREGPLGAWEQGTSMVRTEYLLYGAAFLAVFGATFLGVSKLNTARTLMPALLIFAPFVVLTPRKGLSLVADYVDRKSLRQLGKAVVLTFVLIYFVLNVGLYGSAANEYHPNALIDKGRITESGNLAEKKYFWAMFVNSVYDLRAEEWLGSAEPDRGEYYRYNSRSVISGMYNCTGVSRQPVVRQGTCDSEPARAVDGMDKVYASPGSIIYYDRSAGPRILNTTG